MWVTLYSNTKIWKNIIIVSTFNIFFYIFYNFIFFIFLTWNGVARSKTKLGTYVRTVSWKQGVKSGLVVFHVNSESHSIVEQNIIMSLKLLLLALFFGFFIPHVELLWSDIQLLIELVCNMFYIQVGFIMACHLWS